MSDGRGPRVSLTISNAPSSGKTVAAAALMVIAATAVGAVVLAPRFAVRTLQAAESGLAPESGAAGAEEGEGAKEDAAASSPTKEVIKYERLLAALINQERQRRGLRRLRLSSRLSRVARAHSEEMRDKGYFSHVSPTRGLRTSEDRYFREYSGWYRHLGENIARREGPGLALTQENIVHTHKGLMRSPRHARNILGRDWEIVGVGIATDGGGKYWITEMFLAPWRRSDGRQPPLPRNRKKPTRE